MPIESMPITHAVKLNTMGQTTLCYGNILINFRLLAIGACFGFSDGVHAEGGCNGKKFFLLGCCFESGRKRWS